MIFMSREPILNGKMGKCPIYGDSVELIDKIQELPEGAKITDSNETYTRYEYQGLAFVKKKSKPHQYDFNNVLQTSGGNR